VVALCGVQGWRGAWVREVRELVFALDADAAGPQQWRARARETLYNKTSLHHLAFRKEMRYG
jgi:hypothetical protein